MSETPAFGPYKFSLNNEEARAAAARLALRLGLKSRFERDYVVPLVLFVLLLLFVAILGFTGLINRRFIEATLLVGAIAFLISRFLAHWRLRRAQGLAETAIKALVARGEAEMLVDESGVLLRYLAIGEAVHREFGTTAEAEDAGGLLYLWGDGFDDAPVVIPTRVFSGAEEAKNFLAFARARIGQP